MRYGRVINNAGIECNKSYFLYCIVFASIMSCRTEKLSKIKPTNNKGGYTISILKDRSLKDSVVIYGYVHDYLNNTPLSGASVQFACSTVRVDDKGFYQFRDKGGIETVSLSVILIGYRTVDTENFKLENGDSVHINFILAPDDRPLINCEGKFK